MIVIDSGNSHGDSWIATLHPQQGVFSFVDKHHIANESSIDSSNGKTAAETIELSLYSKPGVEAAQAALSEAFATATTMGNKNAAWAHMEVTMEKYSNFGARDTAVREEVMNYLEEYFPNPYRIRER